jgi:NAD+ synthase (glutamine-hydrolysing)
MRLIKIAAVATNQTPLDWHTNVRNIVAGIESARRAGSGIVCLPELSITGYGCEDAFHSVDVHRRAGAALSEIVPHTKGLIVSVGLPLLHLGALYNCACLIVDGEILGFVAKQNLAGDGIHYEPRWFKPWPAGQSTEITFDGKQYPLGDLIFDCGGIRIGFEICEDAWAARRPGSQLASSAIDIILNPSASHFAFGKQEIRRRLVLEGSRAFGVTYIYANLLGNEAGRIVYDGGTLIASGGEMVAEGCRFSFADYQMTAAVVDLDATRMKRARLASFVPGDEEVELTCIENSFELPIADPEPTVVSKEAWDIGASVKEEEFSRAVALGLFDYLRKSHCRGFVVSLSGGADSSAVSVLVWLVVRFGIGELGRDKFLQKIPDSQDLDSATEQQIVKRLLTCVYQSTRNSSNRTRDAAATLASALGAEFFEFDVDAIVQSYIELASQAVGRDLEWATDDIALQNIQARARGPSVWMLANLQNALLLATSNRSEAAVGYATMDGDTCGSLSPVAGIDKAFLRLWLDWMHREGPIDVGNVPALSLVVSQQPTAELRPHEASQTDEADLMPYDLLDAIERAAIRDKHSPAEVFQLMKVQFSTIEDQQLADWVERFFRLWTRNQWKRERYAPSFHLDDENLDPKTWCRFPILSGGFQQELADMQEQVRS